MIEPFEPARTRFAAMSAEEAVDAAGAVFRKLDLLYDQKTRAACALFRRQDFFPRRAKSRCRSGRLGSTVSARSGGFFSQ